MTSQQTRLYAFACAAALAVRGSSALSASATNCAELAPFITGEALAEDSWLFLADNNNYACDEVTTIFAKGPYKLTVTSDSSDVYFTGVRFEITDGAEFRLQLASEEFVSTAYFTGVTNQESNGGVFHVDSSSSATFTQAMVFEDNSVVSPYHGGAVYAGGMVDFQYMATFDGNAVLDDGDGYNNGGGGGLAVGADSGSVMFHDLAYFMGNEARRGGRGGGMENLGEAYFSRASYFMANSAGEDGDEVGGEGGAIYTGEGSTTTFKRRTIHQGNTADNGGGALWNEGTTTLMSNGYLKDNSAMGEDMADGGHVWTSGDVTVGGFINLRDGRAKRDGGAVYIATGGSLDVGGVVTLERNSADGSCDDVYPCTR